MAKKQLKLKSGFEKKVATKLVEHSIPFEYETHKVKYTVPEKHKNYIPDFILPNGIYIEAKGKLDRDVREKMALVIEQNPDLDIRILFMRDNKIAKNSKTRYSDWCDKRGIVYAVSELGEIPSEWISDALSTTGLDVNTRKRVAPARKVSPRKRAARATKAGSNLSVPERGLPLDSRGDD